MNQKFSVLMSLYIKDKPEYARKCFGNLLRQSVLATEWVIVEDGLLTSELYNLLDKYQIKYPILIKSVPFKKNRGLGLVLRNGILHCLYKLVARMDTDDIARRDRFEKQLAMIEDDPELDICGSHIKDFVESATNAVLLRKVPLSQKEIGRCQKRRDAFSHMTVMYRKVAVLKVGQPCLLMEDTLLWVNMILSGAKCANINDYLVYIRVGDDMFERRGRLSYMKKYRIGRKTVFQTRYIFYWDCVYTLMGQFFVYVVPNRFPGILYKNILREGVIPIYQICRMIFPGSFISQLEGWCAA